MRRFVLPLLVTLSLAAPHDWVSVAADDKDRTSEADDLAAKLRNTQPPATIARRSPMSTG